MPGGCGRLGAGLAGYFGSNNGLFSGAVDDSRDRLIGSDVLAGDGDASVLVDGGVDSPRYEVGYDVGIGCV